MTIATRSSRDFTTTQRLLPDFTFIDLFAGIGGMRLGFESAGGSCVFSSEWDRFARQTYEANFNDVPHGDIREVTADQVPDHDVLLAGFPCQPFSLAGVSKNNALGRGHGFEHATQGTLFFDIARIIEAKRPRAFLLENVKNLRSHDEGRTFEVILNTLREQLGYTVAWKIMDAGALVPQHRERTYIVGFRDQVGFEFPDLIPEDGRPVFGDLLESEPDPRYTLSSHLWDYLQGYAAKHRAKGNGFGFGLVDPNDREVTTRTLSARYHKDGSEILVDTGGPTPRRLTPGECRRLMGFPDWFRIPVSDTQAYRQFGNSVVVPVVNRIAEEIATHLR